MISALLTGLFNLVLTLLATIVQIVLLPINALFNGIFPDFTQNIKNITIAIDTVFTYTDWVGSVIPPAVKTVVVLFITIESALFLILKSTKLTSKLWKVLQKIKLW